MLQSAARRGTLLDDFGTGRRPSILARLRGARRRKVLAGLGALIVMVAIAPSVMVLTGSVITAPADATVARVDADTSSAQAASSAAARRRQTVNVRTGSIATTVDLSGRVASTNEAPLTMQQPGQIKTVPVTVGQAVAAGQLLVELDTSQLQLALDDANSRLEGATARLQQAQAQARIRARDEQTRLQALSDQAESNLRQAQADQARIVAGVPAADLQQAESAVTTAQAEIGRAESELARLRTGASAAERRVAEQQVSSAQLAQQRAEAALERLKAGPDPAAVRSAEQQVTQAQVTLRRAEADQARLATGPDPTELRTAEREFAAAQTALLRAQGEFDRLAAPDPLALAAADREVKRAEVSLRAAKDTKATKDTKSAQQAAVTTAQLSLQDAVDRRNRLQAGPTPWEVDLGRRNLQAARSALDDARAHLETVRQGPSQLDIDAANAAVGVARAGVEDAQTRLQALKAGPPDEDLASATDAVATARTATGSARERNATLTAGPPPDQVAYATAEVSAARSGLQVATTRLSELRSHPTEDELHDAQSRVESATAALARAQAAADAAPSEADDPSAYDRRLLERGVQQEQAQVDALKQQMQASRLEAPTAGVVAQLKASPGEAVDVSSPIAVLAAPGTSIVGAEISSTDGTPLALGQTATVDVGGGSAIPAEVVGFADGLTPNTRLVRFSVNWSTQTPPIGTTARATVITDQHTDALLVPQRAVRSAGQRHYVEVVDGNTTKTITVTEGISANGDVEILSGLTDGQAVVVGS